jgi:ABC-type glycerol-3-phosphate transport system substrate-binding protein
MWKGRLDQIFIGNLRLEALPNGSTTMMASSESILKSNLEIGWAPFPISADGQNDRTTPNLVTCAAISTGTDHPRAAWAWLNFLAAHPILPEWSEAIPAQPSAAESSAYWSKIPEKLREPVQFGLQHGWYTNQYPEELRAVDQALLKAVAQNIDLKAALEEASGLVEAAVPPIPDTTPIVVAPPKPTAVPGEIKINYYSPLSAGNEKIKNLAEGFHQAHPDIEVQVASSSSSGGVAGLAESFDCFTWLPEDNLPVGMLRELDQVLSSEKADIRDDFTPQELEEFSQDGQLYGLPTAYRPNLIYYNANLLAQRGLKPPAVDWTYTDLLEMINAVASSSGPEPVYGFALEYQTPDIELFLAGQGARLVVSSGDVPAYLFDASETRNFVQWLADQVKPGIIFPVTTFATGARSENVMDVRQLILDGRVAFWISWLDQGDGGSYSLKDASFPIGVATMPLSASGTVTWRPNPVVLGQYISRKAQEPRACWEWIKFLSEQPENSLGIPARRSVRESDRWLTQVGSQAAKVYQAALESRRMLSQESGYSLGQTRDWWNELLAETINGADPLPLLAELQRKADSYSACLAASSGYRTGSDQQKTQAETDCAVQANQK